MADEAKAKASPSTRERKLSDRGDIYMRAMKAGRPDVARDQLSRETDPNIRQAYAWTVRDAERVQRSKTKKRSSGRKKSRKGGRS